MSSAMTALGQMFDQGFHGAWQSNYTNSNNILGLKHGNLCILLRRSGRFRSLGFHIPLSRLSEMFLGYKSVFGLLVEDLRPVKDRGMDNLALCGQEWGVHHKCGDRE